MSVYYPGVNLLQDQKIVKLSQSGKLINPEQYFFYLNIFLIWLIFFLFSKPYQAPAHYLPGPSLPFLPLF